MTFVQALGRHSSIPRNHSRLGAALAVASLVGSFAGAANAIPVTLAVDFTQSSLAVSLDADAPVVGTLTGSGISTVSGTLDIDLQDPFGLTPSIAATGGAIGLSDLDINLLDDGLLGTIDIATNGLIADVVGSSVTGTLNGGIFDFDLAGWTLTLDQGSIVVTATGLAALALPSNPVTVDAAATPFAFDLPAPTIANAAFAPAGGGNTTIGVLLPVNISSTVDSLGVPASISLVGQIVLVGEFVPEPTTLVLLLTGLAGLARAGRTTRGA